jgi:serine/alanine racemase
MRNSAIDIAKYVAAILVVGIHTRPFVDVSAELDFAFVEIVCRLAVPFFAVCTGFYLAKAITAQANLTSVLRSLRKVMVMYTGWSMIYLLIHLIDWHNSGTLCSEYLVGWCKSFFVSSSYYHLWYLSALIYALPIYALIIKLAPPDFIW